MRPCALLVVATAAGADYVRLAEVWPDDDVAVAGSRSRSAGLTTATEGVVSWHVT
jgi:hypothetical protein